MARTVLNGLRVFTGQGLTGPQTVVIDGTVIGTDPTGADTTIEADGAVLIPGLIDAHVHLHGTHSLERLRAHGVTTALDMATWPADLVASLRGLPGLTDIRSPGTPAIGPGGMHARWTECPTTRSSSTPTAPPPLSPTVPPKAWTTSRSSPRRRAQAARTSRP